MTTYEVWRERATSRLWAVRLEAGIVTGAIEVEPSEVNPDWLSSYAYSPSTGAEVEQRREAFSLVGPGELILLSAESD
ncbi:MAG TPA: hypothetical protein VFH74_07890 [Gaiellales bacterium]|nr:hypothetical protein [Gaiellales bacterium]